MITLNNVIGNSVKELITKTKYIFIVATLLLVGCNSNTDIIELIGKNDLEQLEIFINENNVNLNEEVENILPIHASLVSDKCNANLLNLLVQNGADINKVSRLGSTSLSLALFNSTEKCILAAINNYGVDVSVKDKNGYNTLHYAVLRPDLSITVLERILNKDASLLSSLSNKNETALDIAIAAKNQQAVDFLSSKL